MNSWVFSGGDKFDETATYWSRHEWIEIRMQRMSYNFRAPAVRDDGYLTT